MRGPIFAIFFLIMATALPARAADSPVLFDNAPFQPSRPSCYVYKAEPIYQDESHPLSGPGLKVLVTHGVTARTPDENASAVASLATLCAYTKTLRSIGWDVVVLDTGDAAGTLIHATGELGTLARSIGYTGVASSSGPTVLSDAPGFRLIAARADLPPAGKEPALDALRSAVWQYDLPGDVVVVLTNDADAAHVPNVDIVAGGAGLDHAGGYFTEATITRSGAGAEVTSAVRHVGELGPGL